MHWIDLTLWRAFENQLFSDCGYIVTRKRNHTVKDKIICSVCMFLCLQLLFCLTRWQQPISIWWCIRLITVSLYLVNVTSQRYHLFIWSVFTPKLLYEGAHILVLGFLTLFMWTVEKICTVIEVSFRIE